jgi:ATP-binding cassette subfamily C protein LapB
VAYSYSAVLQNNRQPMLGQLFSNLMMVAVSTAGAVLVIEGAMSIGSLACCSLLATRVAQPVFRVMTVAAHMKAFALVEERANAVYNLPVMPAPPEVGRLRGSIRLRAVSVPPRGAWPGFKGLDLVVEPGEIVGITGPVNSGKTALLSLIDGTLRPASGDVLIGGWDAASAEMRGLSRALQHIDGHVAIFRGTILENVAMFRGGTYIAEAVAAVEAIGLEAQINKLPEGYDTQIGDGAPTVLPFGFQQSLMIARALAQQPAILLVSQIGALLDIDTFRRLERALRHMASPPTTILASQRGSVLTIPQRIYEIRDGVLYRLGDIGLPAPSAPEIGQAASAGPMVRQA